MRSNDCCNWLTLKLSQKDVLERPGLSRFSVTLLYHAYTYVAITQRILSSFQDRNTVIKHFLDFCWSSRALCLPSFQQWTTTNIKQKEYYLDWYVLLNSNQLRPTLTNSDQLRVWLTLTNRFWSNLANSDHFWPTLTKLNLLWGSVSEPWKLFLTYK